MNKSGAVLIATPHRHFSNGLSAIVRSADSMLTVLQTQDSETASHLLQTTRITLLIIDAVLLRGVRGIDHTSHCLVLVHSAQQERDVRQQQISDILYSDVTTQALTTQMHGWLSKSA